MIVDRSIIATTLTRAVDDLESAGAESRLKALLLLGQECNLQAALEILKKREEPSDRRP